MMMDNPWFSVFSSMVELRNLFEQPSDMKHKLKKKSKRYRKELNINSDIIVLISKYQQLTDLITMSQICTQWLYSFTNIPNFWRDQYIKCFYPSLIGRDISCQHSDLFWRRTLIKRHAHDEQINLARFLISPTAKIPQPYIHRIGEKLKACINQKHKCLKDLAHECSSADYNVFNLLTERGLCVYIEDHKDQYSYDRSEHTIYTRMRVYSQPKHYTHHRRGNKELSRYADIHLEEINENIDLSRAGSYAILSYYYTYNYTRHDFRQNKEIGGYARVECEDMYGHILHDPLEALGWSSIKSYIGDMLVDGLFSGLIRNDFDIYNEKPYINWNQYDSDD
jgi:hypothetical protein